MAGSGIEPQWRSLRGAATKCRKQTESGAASMLKRIIGTIPAAGVAFSALALVACSGGGNGGNGGDDEASARMDRMDQGASVMLAAFSDDPASSGSAQKDKPKPSKEPAKTDKPTPAKKGKSGALGSSREN